MTSVAIIQPYFLAYPGYYQTLDSVDKWVVFDDVQFPRRGWVHRNRFLTGSGVEQWGTLSLRKAPQEASIATMTLAEPGSSQLERLSSRFPALRELTEVLPAVAEAFSCAHLSDLLVHLNRAILEFLGIDVEILRSSNIDYDRSSGAQSKIISICKKLDASIYVNPSGGRHLYDAESFAQQGLVLRFSPEYSSFRLSIAEWIAAQR